MTDTAHDLRSALEPCPFCGETPYWANGGPGNHVVICSGCGASSDDGSRERIAEKWNRRALASDVISNGGGWIVSNGAGDRWRTWNRGWSEWTAMRDHATRYARREDAEAVHAGDEEAWRVEPFVHHPAAEPVGLREEGFRSGFLKALGIANVGMPQGHFEREVGEYVAEIARKK